MRLIVVILLLVALVAGALWFLGNSAEEVDQTVIEQEVELGGEASE